MQVGVAEGGGLSGSKYSFVASQPARNILVLLFCWLGLAAAAPAAGLADAYKSYPAGEYGTAINPPKALPEVALMNEFGEAVAADALQGHITLLFFGFTHCPHICPTTLSMLRGIRDRLPAGQAQQLQVWLVTVDPMRDSAERLKQYLANFGPGFHGARAELGELIPLLQALGVGYSYRADENGESYDVDHTTSIFLLNGRGELARVYTSPHDAQRLLASLKKEL
ncbi:MAG: SCO family protein [Gammaproteobacteria bacterium]